MEVNLPEGNRQELPEGSSAQDLARKIKKKLKGSALAAKINGELKDLTTELKTDDNMQILTFTDPKGKNIF